MLGFSLGYTDGKVLGYDEGIKLGYNGGKVLGSDEGIKLGSTDGKVFVTILGNIDIITLGIYIGL